MKKQHHGRARLKSAISGPKAWWGLLAAPAQDRKVPGTGIAVALAALVGIPVAVVSVSSGAALYYNDASSHLTIARRLFDAINPGFQQLGTVWLPMPHLLLAPLTIPLEWWHTGTSGAILGILCLMATTGALYRVAARLGLGRTGRIAVLATLLINPSILYIHTTALTEPVLIAGIALALAGLTRWATANRTPSGGELAIFAGIPTMIAVMSRYEGWAFLLAATLLITITHRRHTHTWKGLWQPILGYTSVPALAILWWFFDNWATQGDPLAFARGEYSAVALQATAVAQGLVPTKGNLGLSLATYNWSLYYTAGPAILAIAIFGLLVLAYRNGFGTKTLIIGVGLSTYVFSILSLYLGQTIMWNLNTVPVDQFNVRYAMSVMIPVALLIGVAVNEAHNWHAWRGWIAKGAVTACICGIVAQTAWWAADPWQRSAVMAEASIQTQYATNARPAARWLHDQYDGGNVLVDETSAGYGAIPVIGISLSDVITRSSGSLFTDAIADPANYAKWVMVQKPVYEEGSSATTSATSDAVALAVRDQPYFLSQYRLVYSDSASLIFERVN